MSDFKDSASVPLDDISEMKAGIREHTDDLLHLRETMHELANKMQVVSVKQSDTDRGQIEILKQLAENTKVTKDIAEGTAGLVEVANALQGVFKIVTIVANWAKPLAAIVLCSTAIVALWKALG